MLKGLVHREILKLPRGQRKVAEYVMERPHEVAVCSGSELGERTGTSESTVIRFSYNMGFTGYPALQKAIREELYTPESSFSDYQDDKLMIGEESLVYEKVMERDQRAIAETAKGIDPVQFDRAVREILTAENVSVLGLRASYPAASWLSLMLRYVHDGVHVMHPQAEDPALSMARTDSRSVLIVFSFHRYLKETLEITGVAKKRGAFVIGITDSLSAPISAYCDVLFSIESGTSTVDKAAPLFSFLNALVADACVKNPAAVKKKQEAAREIENGFYYVEGI
ncbi:MurR/RpiR family transcriptional regulator [Bhargavaea cecembensis]|nr:MurR/RpiR family transcriptional regulator [Bhargavaea cecembensis]